MSRPRFVVRLRINAVSADKKRRIGPHRRRSLAHRRLASPLKAFIGVRAFGYGLHLQSYGAGRRATTGVLAGSRSRSGCTLIGKTDLLSLFLLVSDLTYTCFNRVPIDRSNILQTWSHHRAISHY